MSDGSKWPQDLEQAAALLRELPIDDAPGWWLGLADHRRAERGDMREDWAWVWAAEVIATFHPERLLPFLTALRPIAISRKQRTLDTVGERLAVGLVDKPTLADCRAAIAEPDEAPRRRSIFGKSPAPPDVDTTLVAVVLDALGCANDSLSRTETATGPELDRSHTAGPQHRVVTSRLRSATCTVQVERTEEFMPGDVNQPAMESREVSVSGTRGGTKLTVAARVGASDVWFDVEAVADERDRILAKLWRAFGRPARPPEEEWQW